MGITQLGFNEYARFYMVAFIPDKTEREILPVAMIKTFGPPHGNDLVWTFGDVIVDVKIAGVSATILHRRYA